MSVSLIKGCGRGAGSDLFPLGPEVLGAPTDCCSVPLGAVPVALELPKGGKSGLEGSTGGCTVGVASQADRGLLEDLFLVSTSGPLSGGLFPA